MNYISKYIPVCGLILAGSVSLPALADDRAQMSKGSHEIHEIMMDSAKKHQAMEMSDMNGDVDKDFAKMMADHHRSGIKMADAQLRYGKNAELKQLAQKIKSSQQMELEKLEKHAQTPH